MSYLSRCLTRTIVLNVRRHVNVNIAQAYYKVSITNMRSLLLRLKELQWGAWGNIPWPFYINAAVTVNAYNATPFYRLRIYVDRMQQYINGHLYCTKPDHLWLQCITLRHGVCDTSVTLGVVVSIHSNHIFLIRPLKYSMQTTYFIPYFVETLSLRVSYESYIERWWVPREGQTLGFCIGDISVWCEVGIKLVNNVKWCICWAQLMFNTFRFSVCQHQAMYKKLKDKALYLWLILMQERLRSQSFYKIRVMT
jgi:hypothetical protein